MGAPSFQLGSGLSQQAAAPQDQPPEQNPYYLYYAFRNSYASQAANAGLQANAVTTDKVTIEEIRAYQEAVRQLEEERRRAVAADKMTLRQQLLSVFSVPPGQLGLASLGALSPAQQKQEEPKDEEPKRVSPYQNGPRKINI